ncbi:MAG: winged helix-turn-helix transcriptional regulator [Rhizobiaceae bacterium]|nr:winged helix-turn-helix transcriptional regulator [Rhizobiaceae bacterium]
MQEPERLDRLFVALADSARRGMVERLARGPASVKELAAPAGMRLPSALKHLKVLEDGGVVASRKVGRIRTYSMRREALEPMGAWMRERQASLEAAFDRLAQAIAEMPEEEDR